MFKGDMGNMMKQAQKMQEDMQKLQEELANAKVIGEAGAGLVKVTMNGRYYVLLVEIDQSLFDEDKEMLEDLIAAATNDAVRRVEENSKKKMGELTAGLGLPPNMKLPF